MQQPGGVGDLRFGAGLWLFGQFVDRYAADAYGPEVSTIEAIEQAGAVRDLEVLDINYPFSDPDMTVEEVRSALEAAGLSAWCVTPHIYMREFTAGAFTNPDPAVRRRALDVCEQAVDVARGLGTDTVKLWPGQDGFDYPFQADYRELWRLELEGVRAVADMDPGVRVAIEYKSKEPRTHMSFSTAARTLVGLQTLGRDDVGIVVDLGHSLFAKETPADVLSLIDEHGKLFTIEVNDNWREWDDDLTVGSVHLIETLEFFQEVRKIGWDKPILLDQFPFREDPVEAARTSIQTIRQIDGALDRLDADALREAQRDQDALGAQRLVLDLLLGGAVPAATRGSAR
jgi:xylose isomerase